MVTAITSVLVADLAVAPLGFGIVGHGLVADLAKVIFVLLTMALIVISVAALRWSRRWTV